MKVKSLLVSACLIVAAAIPCFAMMEVGGVSPARAKEMGIEVQATACGPDQVRVELSFKVAGALEDYSHVQLEIKEGTNFLAVATLKEDQSRSKAGVFVGVTVDRSLLKKTCLMIVTGRFMDREGKEVRVKEFVPAELMGGASPPDKKTTQYVTVAEQIKHCMQLQVELDVAVLRMRLNLTPEQTQRLRQVLEKHQAAAPEIRRKLFDGSIASGEPAQAMITTIRAAIRELLTPEQQRDFTRWLSEQKTN